MWWTLGGLCGLALFLWLFERSAIKRGAAKQRAENAEDIIEDVANAKRIRDNIDAAERERLRKKYTRK